MAEMIVNENKKPPRPNGVRAPTTQGLPRTVDTAPKNIDIDASMDEGEEFT